MTDFFQNIARDTFILVYTSVNQFIAQFGAVNIILVLIALIALIIIFRIIHKHNIK